MTKICEISTMNDNIARKNKIKCLFLFGFIINVIGLGFMAHNALFTKLSVRHDGKLSNHEWDIIGIAVFGVFAIFFIYFAFKFQVANPAIVDGNDLNNSNEPLK